MVVQLKGEGLRESGGESEASGFIHAGKENGSLDVRNSIDTPGVEKKLQRSV